MTSLTPRGNPPGLLTCGPVVVPELAFKQRGPKVKICLDQPLVGPPDIRKLTALCAVADVHIERAIRLNSVETFEERVLTDVEDLCRKLYPRQDPAEALHSLGLFKFYPYLEQGLTSGRLQHLDNHPGTSYLAYVNCLNQLVMMATQIYHDACMPEHHKYLAHQMALLYQCLNQLQGETKPIRRVIESRFDEIKAVTESGNPFFDVDMSNWLQQIGYLCREEVKANPQYIHKRLSPLIATVLHLNTAQPAQAKQ